MFFYLQIVTSEDKQKMFLIITDLFYKHSKQTFLTYSSQLRNHSIPSAFTDKKKTKENLNDKIV